MRLEETELQEIEADFLRHPQATTLHAGWVLYRRIVVSPPPSKPYSFLTKIIDVEVDYSLPAGSWRFE